MWRLSIEAYRAMDAATADAATESRPLVDGFESGARGGVGAVAAANAATATTATTSRHHC